MHFVDFIQFETFKHSTIVSKELNDIISEFDTHIKNTKIGMSSRMMMRNDIKKIVLLKQQLKNLDIMTGFYKSNDIENIRSKQEKG